MSWLNTPKELFQNRHRISIFRAFKKSKTSIKGLMSTTIGVHYDIPR